MRASGSVPEESGDSPATEAGAPLRLTLVINSLEGGGAERVAAGLLERFAAAPPDGIDPTGLRLVLLDQAPRRYAVAAGVPTAVLDARGSLQRSAAALGRLLARDRPDVTLSFLTRANLAAALAARLGGWACVLSERVNTSGHFAAAGLRGRMSRALIRVAYPTAERVIAVSRGVADDLAANFGVRRDRLRVINNPYDIAGLTAAAQRPPAIAPPRPYVVAVGRLTANKNHALLIEAYAAAGIAEDLVILGDGEERAALEALVAARGLAGRVHLPGFLAEPHPVVARARAYVSASNAEGFPNAAAEAMALGRVVLATDCPSGPGELLGGTAPPGGGPVAALHGLLTPVGDAAALAEGLRLALSPGMQARYAPAAAARLAALSPAAIAEAYAATIREAVAMRAAARARGAAHGAER